jgi:pimeloyl-ACP methyl ester carboxylesterase
VGRVIKESTLSILCDGHRLAGGAASPEDPRGLVLLLHGIPSVTAPEPGDEGYPGLARTFAAAGWVGAWVDMRSVRGSPGDFSIQGWVRDARAAFDAARTLDGASALPTAVVGSSAGGAVAAELVRRGAPVNALALLAAPAQWLSFAVDAEEAFRRVVDEAGMTVAASVRESPEEWMREFDEVATERSMIGVRVPTLIVHGDADDVVPVDHAGRIADRAPNAEARIVVGAGHQLRRDPEATSIVLEWLARVMPR